MVSLPFFFPLKEETEKKNKLKKRLKKKDSSQLRSTRQTEDLDYEIMIPSYENN